MKSLVPALIKFQASVPVIPKNCINPFFSQGGKKAMYADLATVIDICKPALNKAGLAVVQSMRIQEGKNCLQTVLLHESGESIDSIITLPEVADAQKLTAAITYLRRSTYLSILGLVAEDEDDGNSVVGNVVQPKQERPQGQRPEPAPSEKQLNYIKMLADKAGVPMPVIKNTQDADAAIKQLTAQGRR